MLIFEFKFLRAFLEDLPLICLTNLCLILTNQLVSKNQKKCPKIWICGHFGKYFLYFALHFHCLIPTNYISKLRSEEMPEIGQNEKSSSMILKHGEINEIDIKGLSESE